MALLKADGAAGQGSILRTPSAVSMVTQNLTLHELAFRGDATALARELRRKAADINGRDAQGNTPLLVAVLLGHKDCVKLLLDAGADTTKKTAGKWPTIAEAISVGHRDTVKLVFEAYVEQIKARADGMTQSLLEGIEKMPDFYVEIAWDFHSWVPLVSRVLPSDTLRIWKHGLKVRMDSTLLDVSEQSLKRGDMSFLFHGNAKHKTVFMTVVNREKKTFLRQKVFGLSKGDDDSGEDAEERLEEDVTIMMGSDIVDVDVNANDVQFARAWSGWPGFREERSEKIGEYEARVYNISNCNMVNRTRREHLSPEDIRKNKEYTRRLRAMGRSGNPADLEDLLPEPRSLPAPDRATLPWEEYAAAEPGAAPHLGRSMAITQKSRSFRATAWMSDEFPLKVPTIVQLLTVLAPTGKQVARLRDFVDGKLPPGFPVKMDIPVFPTVSARVVFRAFSEEPIDDATFTIPPTFRERKRKRHSHDPPAADSDSGSASSA